MLYDVSTDLAVTELLVKHLAVRMAIIKQVVALMSKVNDSRMSVPVISLQPQRVWLQ